MDTKAAKLAEAEARLREVIHAIVKRRATNEKRLNWRMMFEIEDEAVSIIQQDAELDLRYINMMVSPSAQRRHVLEESDATADLYAMHTALWMIQEAYYREAHRTH